MSPGWGCEGDGAVSDQLVVTLARAMAQLLAAIDLTDDDEVDPDVASPWFEGVAAEFDRLSDENRRELAGLIRRVAVEETNPTFRAAILAVPESFGLEDGEEACGPYRGLRGCPPRSSPGSQTL
jgi:hypothetical protein